MKELITTLIYLPLLPCPQSKEFNKQPKAIQQSFQDFFDLDLAFQATWIWVYLAAGDFWGSVQHEMKLI